MACFADPYALLFLPSACLLVVLVLRDEPLPRREVFARVGAAAGGALAGALPLALLMSRAQSMRGEATLTTRVISHNLRLLLDECLPWAIGTKVYFARHMMDYAPWGAPLPI